MLAPAPGLASAQSADVAQAAQQIIDEERHIRGLTPEELLNHLTVRTDAGPGGYDRESFGRWVDPDGNGCDTRNDILFEDLVDAVQDSECKVTSGRLTDPYTGEVHEFVRQAGASSQTVEIDHVVSLSDAWRSGAHDWDQVRKVAFYNDRLNLKASLSEVNQDKSDHAADSWLPDVDRAGFADTQIRVKAKYGLSVTAAEKTALATALTQGTGPADPRPGEDTPGGTRPDSNSPGSSSSRSTWTGSLDPRSSDSTRSENTGSSDTSTTRFTWADLIDRVGEVNVDPETGEVYITDPETGERVTADTVDLTESDEVGPKVETGGTVKATWLDHLVALVR